jgi:uncharacterized phage protein (TIGR02218 family)
MLPSAIRRTASLEMDSAEVRGALSHDAITADDLSAGRYDGAQIVIGLVDWESLDRSSLYHGAIGDVSTDAGAFEAELRSAKVDLTADLVPRTSPSCRARFCGPGCTLSATRFTHEAVLVSVDPATAYLDFAGGPPAEDMLDGFIRWVDGPHAGLKMRVMDAGPAGILLDADPSPELGPGIRALLREGCDHTLATCEARFGNSINFQGEPFLPGNDALLRYPTSTS